MAQASNQSTTAFDERRRMFGAFLRLVRWSVGVIAVALIVLFLVFVGNPYA